MSARELASTQGYSPLAYRISHSLLALFGAVWLRLHTEGREHVPQQGPLLVVANHCSYLDPPLLGIGVVRPVRFLAQQGLARVPLLGWWMRKVGVRLIDRNAPSKDVLRWLSDALVAGNCVAMFPEGTRSADGLVGPFRNGVEFLVRRTGAPVLPMGIEGSFRALSRTAWFPRPVRCTVRCGPVWPKERVLAADGTAALRREIAQLAHAHLRDHRNDGGAGSERVGHGPGAIPADSSSSAGGRT
jgi:1-acyl-sn-glycerol-3-phosphate acyltransferase